MALTPEDVVNKRFQTTKFREGYDQDEVDDFLDEVVAELRRLVHENEDLRQRLAAAEQAANATPVQEPVAALAEQEPAAAVTAEAAEHESENATNLLQLARRLHEEHVREGIQKRDALIAEGEATAKRLVSEAETTQRTQLQQYEQQKAVLEQNIEELRSFERDYRAKLKSFIDGQLQLLDASGTFAPPTTAEAPVAAPAE